MFLGLKPGTNYRIYISATTRAGESKRYFIERSTKPKGFHKPGVPKFRWEPVRDTKTTSVIRVYWIPSDDGKTGSHFYVKYKKRGETTYLRTTHEKNEDFQEGLMLRYM